MTPSRVVLQVEALSKRFGGVHALDGVNLSLRQEETLGLLGPNGSGKTTLVNCISGVLLPDAGSVHLDEHDITKWSRPRRARHKMVRTYQNLKLFRDMTVAENIETGLSATTMTLRRAKRDHLVRQAIAVHGLDDVRRNMVKSLSYGQQRRVEIARALIASPRVLLLDEPAAGLGERDTQDLSAAIAAARADFGCAIILIDHDVEFVATMSDRMSVLHKGEIVRSGTPAEIQSDPMVARIYLGTAADSLPIDVADPRGGTDAHCDTVIEVES